MVVVIYGPAPKTKPKTNQKKKKSPTHRKTDMASDGDRHGRSAHAAAALVLPAVPLLGDLRHVDELGAALDALHAAWAARYVVVVSLSVMALPRRRARLRPRCGWIRPEHVIFVDGEVAAERVRRALG